jgi:hypothetical protein
MPIIMYNDVSDLKAQVVIQEVMGLARVQYRLRELCKTIQMPKLVADMRFAVDYTGSAKVPELVEADIKAQSYSKQSFELWKNVVHLAISAEADLKTDVNILELEMASAAKELARLENSQIASEIETNGTTVASTGAWNTKSSGVSTYDPVYDLLSAEQSIFDAGYDATIAAMHFRTYTDLITNTHITSLLERGGVIKTAVLPAIAGLQLLVDENITNTVCYLIDPSAPSVILGEGPTLAVRYGDDNPKFYKGYAIAQFLQPKVAVTNGFRVMTAVHA